MSSTNSHQKVIKQKKKVRSITKKSTKKSTKSTKKSTNKSVSKNGRKRNMIDPNLFISGQSILTELSKLKYHAPYYGNYKKKSFMTNSQTNIVNVELNKQFSMIDHVPGLKTALYQHQKTAVKAMLDMENGRSYEQKEKYNANNAYKITFNTAVLSEPVGSGKTIDILAVICLSKIPKVLPDIMELDVKTNFRPGRGIGYIRRKFKKFLKPTIIFVGSSVLKQWENAIQTFTSLKFFSVNGAANLRTLFSMIENNTVNNYDIILVKNGKVTVKVDLPCGAIKEPKNNACQPYIYNLIGNLREHCWARVVVDDFDTIKLPSNAGIITGIFTWYISSTRKRMEYRKNSVLTKFTRASQFLESHDYGCASIMYNNTLFNSLNIRNNIDYLKSTTKIPYPKFHVALFVNPNNGYIQMLASMGDQEVNRITEMLNGDAYNEAAEAAGIKSDSVADIFGTILGIKYKNYKHSSDVLDFIDYQRDKEDERMPIPKDANLDEVDEDDVKIYRYGKTDLISFREIEYKFPNIKGIIKDTEEEYTGIKTTSGLAIQRVKDNIKHGVCPVCHMDLHEAKGAFIMKCCQAVFCESCGINAQNLNDRYTRLQKGRCSNCRSTVSIKDLIYIGDNIDMDDIEEENLDDDDDSDDEEEKKEEKEEEEKEHNKFTAIIAIIRGEKIPMDKRVDMHIPNMMKGANYLPEAKTRKVLIFANYDETLHKVIKELKKTDIKFWRLQGGVNEINRTSLEFTNYNGTCAMVINSTRHCSGLNLQTATDLIFAHKMQDPAIESQVAGRGHRLGRTNPLNIWYILYENEYNSLYTSHSVREFTQADIKREQALESGTSHSTIEDVRDNSASSNL